MINKHLPLTDLHRHLDGNIRPETILSLAQQHNIQLPSLELEVLRPHVQIVGQESNLVSFLTKLDWGVAVLADLDACRRVALENVEDAFNAGIDYAELRFSPYYMAMKHQLPVEAVVEAIIDGVEAGCRQYQIKINLIGILSRTFGQQACAIELNGLLAHRNKLCALDLAGDELGFPGELFEEHFIKARNSDLNITVHAGEAAGASSIWHAIKQLGAQRIGHGVKAIEDPLLIEYLVKNQIGMESCLTSNIQTSTIATLAEHPLKTFLSQGVLATINTDDPAVQGIELRHEYEIAAPEAGLTASEIEQAQRNGLTIAFLSDDEKKALIQKAANR